MKKVFLITAVASLFAACNSDSKSDMETTKAVVADSAQYKNSASTDTAKGTAKMPATPASDKKEEHHETKISSEHEKSTRPATSKKVDATTTNTTSTITPTTPASSTTPVPSTVNTPAPVATATPEKKGMSNSAKDAIIGGGAGAIGGAIISKKKGKGAIIGGLLGAGAGFILGKNKDKKDTTR